MAETPTYWFKPKNHGYGAVPSSWQGWVATSAFTLVMVFGSLAFFLTLTPATQTIGTLLWVAVLLAAVYAFTNFARKRTDGEWGYRWKGQLYRDMRGDGDGQPPASSPTTTTDAPDDAEPIWPAAHRR